VASKILIIGIDNRSNLKYRKILSILFLSNIAQLYMAATCLAVLAEEKHAKSQFGRWLFYIVDFALKTGCIFSDVSLSLKKQKKRFL
jgi:hypothetical protein